MGKNKSSFKFQKDDEQKPAETYSEEPDLDRDSVYDQAFKLIAGEISWDDASEEVKAARKSILDGSWMEDR